MKNCAVIFIHITLFGYINGQMPKKPSILPLKDDIPFIACDVCKKAATVLFKSVREKRKVKSSKLGEEELISIVEKTCDAESDHGEWIKKLDIVEDAQGLSIVSHSSVGKCKEECKTISRACDDVIGDIDTDIAEILWQNSLKLSPFVKKVCFELSTICMKKKPKFRKGKRKDFKFVEMTEKDLEAMEAMKKMQGMPGMPGMEMYSKEDLEDMKQQMGMKDMPSQEQHAQQQEGSPPEHSKTQLNFFDTVKILGKSWMTKVKGFFSYLTGKTEL